MDASTLYASSAVTTAAPNQLVTLLYDRVLIAIDRAETALRPPVDAGAQEQAHHELVRAQDILSELQVTLDHERGGVIATNLSLLYDFCHDKLLEANITKDATELPDVRAIVSELRSAWHTACCTAAAV